ncbi:hypothetical protein HaLaN_23666, partial [Haematococcus lacustris]
MRCPVVMGFAPGTCHRCGGRSESQSFKEVAEEVELSKLSQLATALSLPTTDSSKRGQQGLCGYS